MLSLREFQSWQILDPKERLQSVPSVITFLASSREGEKRRGEIKKGRGGYESRSHLFISLSQPISPESEPSFTCKENENLMKRPLIVLRSCFMKVLRFWFCSFEFSSKQLSVSFIL